MTGPSDIDDYAVAAEHYDLWAADHWRQIGPELAARLEGVDPSAGPVLDVGAGTGVGTVLIADAVPGVQVLAVEPSRAMRVGLVTRLMTRPDLRGRVTVLQTDLAGVDWPAQLAGFVAMAMLGHLEPAARLSLWRDLAAHLAPSAPAVVLLQPPGRPETVPAARHTRARLGQHDYEGWAEAVPVGPHTLRWTMSYRVLRGGQVIDEQQWSSDFHTVNEDDVRTEAGAAGLTVDIDDSGLATLRRRLP
jgi:SAM-dependent methyltransferase